MPAQPGEESGSGSDSEYEDGEAVQKGGRKRAKGGARLMQTAKRARQDSDTAVTLFEVVRQGKMAMTAIVDDWIEAYKADRNEALLDLIQFFINAAGCKGTVTADMLRDASEGFQDVIKKMTEEFDEDSGDYPLITSGYNFKKFRSNFSDFVQALVRQCQFQIIYDQFMMDNVLTLLTELSNSQVRAFRHTSTLAAMKLMTALVNVALQLSVSLDNTQRQYEGERNKAANKRASEKLDLLLEKRKDLEDQQTEIESMLNGIFKGIFVHRYRDYIADIRALCMDEIGVWMKMFPKVFLTDSYLKYVGWTLHDKQKEVRLKCLQTLQGLYKDEEMTKDLKLFTSRFKDRIVSMTLDKEYDVSVFAIKLLILILDHCGYDTPVLSSVESESVYQLVYSVHRPVAIAAAEFLNKQLFTNKDITPGYTKRGRRRSANAPLVTDLVLFFIESELHEHATYLVDSLWDAASGMLKDWDCMTDLLLEEPANDRDQLDTRQESALVDIMVCSVKQAAEGTPPTGRHGYSKKLAVRDRRTVLEDRVRLTEHFIVALPSLLNKYQVDKEKATMLLQIPRFFDLELYTASRLEKHLEMLLRQMAVIIDKHTDSDLLEQAAMTYHVICDNDYTMATKAQIERQTVVDSWVENFTLALDIFKDATSDGSNGADDEEIYNVVQALKRLTHIYQHNNISSCGLHPNVFSILQMYQEKPDSVPEDMLDQALRFLHCDLMYAFSVLKEREDPDHSTVGPPDQSQEIAQLRQRVTEFVQICEDLLSKSPHPKVKEASYMAVCDLIILFSPQLAHSCPNLRPLVQRPSDALQHLLIDFINTYVFVVPEDEDDDEEDNAKIDALHHRRLLLAAICKLFIFNMIELRLAASVFQQYIRFYADYGDIIKETISKSRHANKMECAHTLVLSLMTLYRETVRRQGGSLDHSSQEYGHMKELARRLSLTFGLDQVKTRDAVAALHKEGILFALKRSDDYNSDTIPPENLSFLSILVEFSSKLMKQDRKTVMNYMDKHIKPHMLKQQTAGWIPLVTYRNSLMQGMLDEADPPKQQSKARRGGRKKRQGDGDMEAPRTPMTPATPMSETGGPMTPMNPVPQHTSTAQREPGPPKQMRMEEPNVSGISYQQPQEGQDLQSWLSTGRTNRRNVSKNGNQSANRTDSIEEQDETGEDNSSEASKPEKKRSFLASIFSPEQDISEKMKGIQVKDSRKAPGRGRKREESSRNEEEERDSSKIEDFTEKEVQKRVSRRKNNPLPELDEEVITGFVQDAFMNANENEMDAESDVAVDNVHKNKKKTTVRGSREDFPRETKFEKSEKNNNPASRMNQNKMDAEIENVGNNMADGNVHKKAKKAAVKGSHEDLPREKKFEKPGKICNPASRMNENKMDHERENAGNNVADGNVHKKAKKASVRGSREDLPREKKFEKSGNIYNHASRMNDNKMDDENENAGNNMVDDNVQRNKKKATVRGSREDLPRERKFENNPASRKNEDADFFPANEEDGESDEALTDVLSDQEEQNAVTSYTQELATATNPFWNITKNIRKDVSRKYAADVPAVDAVLSDFMNDDDSVESPLSPFTEKSTTTARTHISDVEVEDLLRERKFEKSEKMFKPVSQKNKDDDFFSANEDDGESDETFEDVLLNQEEKDTATSYTQSGRTQELATSTNPFWNITKNMRKGAGDAPTTVDAVLSDFMSDDESDDSLMSPVTQKSVASARTHISDVDVMGLLMDEDNLEQQEEVFGAFTSVVRDVHSQSSQNITSLSGDASKKSSGLEMDDIFSEDEDDDPFAEMLRPLTSRPLISPTSPFSSDGEDDNFNSMFGFQKKERKNKRQPNLMGTSLSAMASTTHQGGYRQQHSYQIPNPNIPGTSLQQFAIPGQPMMYQQPQGYQMQMQSPSGHLQQPGMPGQPPPYYGN